MIDPCTFSSTSLLSGHKQFEDAVSMEHFTDLQAWKTGLELVKEVYAICKLLPKEELFGITSQLRRSSTSILANIAEGCGRYTYPDKAAKFTIARGECSEVEAFLHIIVAIGYVQSTVTQRALGLLQRERRLISGMITSCRHRAHP